MALAVAGGGGGAFGVINGFFGQYSSDRLKDHCDSGVDTVTLSFVTSSPENEPSGLPGTNFAGHCWKGTYANKDGVDSDLQSNCYWMKRDIPYCKSRGVKILLSIGGESTLTGFGYSVGSDENGESFADFLYGAFGPYNSSWTGPRPFDVDEAHHASIDGFDFDIENSYDNHPYVAMINRFRSLQPGIVITGSPQCPLLKPWAYMSDMIQAAAFDRLNVQFYNNPGCNAAPDTALLPLDDPTDITSSVGLSNKFNYDDWEAVLANSDSSQGAKIFIGLPASTQAAQNGYLTPDQMKSLICKYKNKPHFGGVSLWDLSFGSLNVIDGKNYQAHVLDGLQHGCGAAVTATSKTSSVRKPTSKAATTSTGQTAIATTSASLETTSALNTSTPATTSRDLSSTTSQYGNMTTAFPTATSGVSAFITSSQYSNATSAQPTSLPETLITSKYGSESLVKPSSGFPGQALPTISLSLGLDLGMTESVKPTTTLLTSASASRSVNGSMTTTASYSLSPKPTGSGDTGLDVPIVSLSLGLTISAKDSATATAAPSMQNSTAASTQQASGSQVTPSQSKNSTASFSGGIGLSASTGLPRTSSSAGANNTSDVPGSPMTTTRKGGSSNSTSTGSPTQPLSTSVPLTASAEPTAISALETSTKIANATSVLQTSRMSSTSTTRQAGPSALLDLSLGLALPTPDAQSTASVKTDDLRSTMSRQANATASGVSATISTQIAGPSLGLGVGLTLGLSLPGTPTQLGDIAFETSNPSPLRPASTTTIHLKPTASSDTATNTTKASTAPSSGIPGMTMGPGGWNTTAPAATSVATIPSTIYTTVLHTITKCPPNVVDCPVGKVTTGTIPLFTTTLLVTQVASPIPAITEAASWTQSTALTTQVHTITSCAPDAVNCPIGQVVTKTIALYTTYCPVTATAFPSGTGLASPIPQASQAGAASVGVPVPSSSGLWTTTRPSSGFVQPSGQPSASGYQPNGYQLSGYTASHTPDAFYAPPFPHTPGSSDLPQLPKPPSGTSGGPDSPAPIGDSPPGKYIGSPPGRPSTPVVAGASMFGASAAGIIAVMAIHIL